MNPSGYTARRATLDELPALLALWRTEKLDVAVLEKRFTEFQLALDAGGQVVGAIGLLIDGRHGLLHSECFSDFGLTDKLRPLLWDRLQVVARNRGLTRLWLREDTLFFRGEGFDPASADVREQLPAGLSAMDGACWTLKLKDDLLANMTPAQELALFKKLSDEGTEQLLRQAQVLRWIAVAVGVLFFLGVVVVGFYLWRYYDYKRQYGVPPTYQPRR